MRFFLALGDVVLSLTLKVVSSFISVGSLGKFEPMIAVSLLRQTRCAFKPSSSFATSFVFVSPISQSFA
jgi:hypothetical protein